MTDYTWVVMPIAGARAYTDAAISDVLAQTVPTKLLLVTQGIDTDYRRHLEQIQEAHEERVFGWHFDPALPSLSAAWNRALRFVWETGGTRALVVNNDTRFHREMLKVLDYAYDYDSGNGVHPLFISAVGVTEAQFDPTIDYGQLVYNLFGSGLPKDLPKGGPDFSCFMLSKEGHAKYPFDEGFIPAFCEDLDMHRRYMLGGDGDKIFSVNLPYLHFASQTLKTMDPEKRARVDDQITRISRAHYQAKWGGPVNGERFTIPFDAETAQDGVTTPDLQRALADVPTAT